MIPPTIAPVELCELVDDKLEAEEVLLPADDSEDGDVTVAVEEEVAESKGLVPVVGDPEFDEEEPNELDGDDVLVLDGFEGVIDVLVLELPAIVTAVPLPDESEPMLVGELFEVAESEGELLEEGEVVV